MSSHVELVSVPLTDGTVVCECSLCGPLEITMASAARAVLLAHLNAEHVNKGAHP